MTIDFYPFFWQKSCAKNYHFWSPPHIYRKFKSPFFTKKNAASLKFLSPFWSTQGQQWPQFYNCKVTYNAMQSCTVEYFSQNKFNFQKTWYSLTKIVLTYNEKKIDLVIKKNFWIRGWRRRIWKNFEITRAIYSNSEGSEQFLVTECFFNLFLEVSHVS